MKTFQTRFQISQSFILEEMAALLSKAERCLFVELQKNERSLSQIKSDFIRRFGITARHFNACKSVIEGKIRSLKEIQKKPRTIKS